MAATSFRVYGKADSKRFNRSSEKKKKVELMQQNNLTKITFFPRLPPSKHFFVVVFLWRKADERTMWICALVRPLFFNQKGAERQCDDEAKGEP